MRQSRAGCSGFPHMDRLFTWLRSSVAYMFSESTEGTQVWCGVGSRVLVAIPRRDFCEAPDENP